MWTFTSKFLICFKVLCLYTVEDYPAVRRVQGLPSKASFRAKAPEYSLQYSQKPAMGAYLQII
jgi:hypothetical protein